MINRLFKGIAVVLTAIGAIVIVLQAADLIKSLISFFQLPPSRSSFGLDAASFLIYVSLAKNANLIIVASVVEIALIWLLVLLDVISRRSGLIATLVLFILVGIAVFIVADVAASSITSSEVLCRLTSTLS